MDLRVVPLTLRMADRESRGNHYADGGEAPNVRVGPFVARLFLAQGADGLAAAVIVIPFPVLEMARAGVDMILSQGMSMSAIGGDEDWTEGLR